MYTEILQIRIFCSHYTNVQCLMILQKYSNTIICCSRNIFIFN